MFKDKLMELVVEAGRPDLVDVVNDNDDINILEAVYEEVKGEVDGDMFAEASDQSEAAQAGAKEAQKAAKDKSAFKVHDYMVKHQVDEDTAKKATTLAKDGKIAAGIAMIAAACVGVTAAVKTLAKKLGKSEADKLEKEIADIEKRIEELKKQAKDGEITASKAIVEITKLKKQANDLTKAAEKAAKDANVTESVEDDEVPETEEEVKESAASTKSEVMLKIYESADAGDITPEQKELLLEMMKAAD